VRALLPLLRGWDQRAARGPDCYVANSALVARRIESVYGREAPVVYPPISPDRFERAAPLDLGEPYFLVVSRLLPYKRVDLVVAACAALDVRLVVVGTGPAEASLRAQAGPRCEFRSGVGDAELRGLLAGCTALVQPGVEDFGLTPLEANAAGRPVVAFGAGGALESVVDGVTGVHFTEQSVAALQDAIARVRAKAWRPKVLRRYARVASEERFRLDLTEVVSDALADRSRSGGQTGRQFQSTSPETARPAFTRP
jgi:glycosyltransferase involved in cell wall biosynthesis